VRLWRAISVRQPSEQKNLDFRLHRDRSRVGGAQSLSVRGRRPKLQLRPAADHLSRQDPRVADRAAEVAMGRHMRGRIVQLPLSVNRYFGKMLKN
jgi:hypothetical protein